MDEIKWIKSESIDKPKSSYVDGDGTICVSRNVEKKTRFDEQTKTNIDYYEFEIAWMTSAQFEAYTLETKVTDLEDMILELSEEVYK